MILKFLYDFEAPLPPEGKLYAFIDINENIIKGKLETGEIVTFGSQIEIPGVEDEFLKTICYYGYVENNGIVSHEQFDESFITLSSVKRNLLNNILNRDLTISAPAGSLVFALIKKNSNYIIKRSNGISGKCSFDENNGCQNSGINGKLVSINNEDYLLFCEFNLINVDTIICFCEV